MYPLLHLPILPWLQLQFVDRDRDVAASDTDRVEAASTAIEARDASRRCRGDFIGI